MLIEHLAEIPSLYIATLIVLGLVVGSFLNVAILRLPKSMEHQWITQCQALLEIKNDEPVVQPPSLSFPASHCPKCQTPLKWWHNIPVVSYIALRAKCHSCQKSISLRYPTIELLTAILTLVAGLNFPETKTLPWILVLVWLLIVMSIIDLDTQLLPDNLTLPLMWLGLLFSITPTSFVSPTTSIIGAAVGYMVLWSLFQVHYFITKKEGMGYGDFKLLAATGAWLGWQALPFVLLIAAGTGLLIALILIIFKNHSKDRPISFGPYLAIGFLINLFWGDVIVDRYLNFAGIAG